MKNYITKSICNPLFSFSNLLKAYYQCRRRKRKTTNAAKFELNFENELLKLEQELQGHTYKPGRSICFVVAEPKPREVFAADFRDRVIHHLLVNHLEPIWEKKFIHHSYSCRKDKGAHCAVKDLKKFLKQVSQNFSQPAYPVRNKSLIFSEKTKSFSSKSSSSISANPTISNGAYYLQVDISAFFMSLKKDILFDLINRHLKNPELLWLIKQIIFHDPTKNFYQKGNPALFQLIPSHKSLFKVPENQGLPIGNLTSQFFANIYLNELDQFAKHELKAKHYLRYVDDLLLLHQDLKQLKIWERQLNQFLKEKLKLHFHPQKTILQSIHKGINFVGFIVCPNHTLIRNRAVRKFKNKLWLFNKKILSLNLEHPIRLWTSELCQDFQKIFATVNSYYGQFKHADTFRLRQHLYEKHFGILKIYLIPVDKNYSHMVWSND